MEVSNIRFIFASSRIQTLECWNCPLTFPGQKWNVECGIQFEIQAVERLSIATVSILATVYE
jgi:hypothetical protein